MENSKEMVNDTLALAEGVSNYGFMTVAGAAVIFAFLIVIIYLFLSMRNQNRRASALQDKNDKRYDEYIATLTNSAKDEHKQQIEAIQSTNSSLAQLLYRQSNLYEKSQTIIECLLQNSAHLVIREINNIKHENGIDDHEFTLTKCRNRAINITDFRKRRMAIFEYKGKPLNDACDPAFTEDVIGLMHKEIYRDGPNSYIATRNEVEELFDDQKEKMLQIIKTW